MRREGPYGTPVLQTPDGTWYWAEEFHQLAYVPTGKRRATVGEPVPVAYNNLAGAIRHASHHEFRNRGGL
jgi:hypothetical protein